jgi:hypothetical protein
MMYSLFTKTTKEEVLTNESDDLTDFEDEEDSEDDESDEDFYKEPKKRKKQDKKEVDSTRVLKDVCCFHNHDFAEFDR